ncbi:MAG: hypothetical protein ACRERE_16810 [Candidatus Entotheonellia bacterium]
MLEKQAIGGRGYDWTMILLSFWFLAGVFLDGWAHNHIPELESFFTPWHAVFYSGFLAVAGFLMATLVRNHAKGYPWRQAMPPGYELSCLGVLIFIAGGVGDMIWHEIFGIEANIEALLSPSHLSLALGASLFISGPFRSSWRRASEQNDRLGRWVDMLPPLLSLTFLLSLWTFMTQFGHPLVETWAAAGFRPRSQNFPTLRQSLGVVSILVQAGLLMGLVLLAILRWVLPLGSLTLVFTLNAILMSVMQDQYRLIPAAAMAGFAADLLLRWLRPSMARSGAFRLFAFAVPTIDYTLYFVVLIVTQGLAWSVHLWTGSIALAGVVGLLLSYLLIPPAQGSPRLPRPASRATIRDRELLRS